MTTSEKILDPIYRDFAQQGQLPKFQPEQPEHKHEKHKNEKNDL